MLTEEVASVALNFGADDMDGTVGGEKIAHDAGAIAPMALAKDQIIRMIRDAGKIPVQRDVYYNPLELHADRRGRENSLSELRSVLRPARAGAVQNSPVVPRRMGQLVSEGHDGRGALLPDGLLQERGEAGAAGLLHRDAGPGEERHALLARRVGGSRREAHRHHRRDRHVGHAAPGASSKKSTGSRATFERLHARGQRPAAATMPSCSSVMRRCAARQPDFRDSISCMTSPPNGTNGRSCRSCLRSGRSTDVARRMSSGRELAAALEAAQLVVARKGKTAAGRPSRRHATLGLDAGARRPGTSICEGHSTTGLGERGREAHRAVFGNCKESCATLT